MSYSPAAGSPSNGDLPPMDVAGRLARLRAEFETNGLQSFLVTKPVNIRWLSGFTGSNGKLFVTTSGATLVTDARYTDQADLELRAARVDIDVEIAGGDGADVVHRLLRSAGPTGVEATDLSMSAHRSLVSGGGNLIATEAVIDTLRQPKDRGEIARLRRASEIADHALRAVLPMLVDGPTERRFGAELDYQMRLLGAEDISFETIIAAGPNGARPHARPSDRVIRAEDLVVIDFGARVDGYGSDMTRTVLAGGSAGQQPTSEQADLYDAVATAQQAGVDAVADGVPEIDIDTVCRQSLIDRGLGEAFMHGTGHGIGLEIHEQPILSSRSVGILRAGLVVTVEPGAYLPGFGGVRVEDSVVVTASGCEPITHSPKGLVPDFGAPENERTLPNGDDHK